MSGTNSGTLGDRPPTGARISVKGMTIHYFRKGRIAGHSQVADRLAVVQQLAPGR